uniref:HDC14580 n=1 Tax=Drosophila melanogaster TaxID=7227 RepID=Q6IJN4_DROME|nr:TPA_inf: HDC14580 [Drosophila melanogaster]
MVTGSGFAVIRMIKPFDKGTKSTQADKLRREKIPMPMPIVLSPGAMQLTGLTGLVWAITKGRREREADGGTGVSTACETKATYQQMLPPYKKMRLPFQTHACQ